MGEDIQCSRCGSRGDVDVCFAACVATTQWSQKDRGQVTTNDDIRLWRIPICRTCIPGAYRTHLQSFLASVADPLGWLTLTFFASGLFVVYKAANPEFMKPLPWVVAVGVALALLAGVVGVPVLGLIWLVHYIKLRAFERTGTVSAKQECDAFSAEAERILEALLPESGKPTGEVWGEYALPEHKTLEQIELKPEEKQHFSNPVHERKILVVGKTIDDVEEQVSIVQKEWLALLQRTHTDGA